MASVRDVFAQMQAEQAEVLADETFTPDPNEYCMLESDATRRILIPQKYAVFGVESDEKTNLIKFAFPKTVNNIQDLSQYSLRFNYMNAVGNTDQCLAQNIEVQGDYVTFDWLLTRNVTRYQGNISFIVCAVTTNEEDGTITNEWNTTLATAQSLEGLETVPTPGEEQIARDLLTELLVSLNNSKNNAITEITQTKTQAISDIQAEGQTQTEAVDAKGAQVLESIPDDYTTLENRVDELEQNRAYVIVGNDSGEFVTLNDSSGLKTRNIKLFGKSVQKPTTGVQLFNINKLKELDDGVEIIDYSTGEMEISQQSHAMLPVRLSDICPNMVEGQTYYLTGETTSNNKYLRVGAKQWNFDEALVLEESDLLVQCNFECTTQTGQSGEIIYYKDTFKNIMIVEGSTEKPYEVYTGGEAATEPTPDYPLPITSAGNYNAESEKYEIGIGVDGVNLLDYESWKGTDIVRGTGQYINNGVVLTASETDCFTEYTLPDVYKIPVLPSTTYVLSWECSGGYGLVYVFENSKLSEQYPINSYTGNSKNKLVFTTGNNANYIKFRVGVLTAGETATYKNIQLNVGDTPLEFKPFQGTQQKQLQIPNPLRGIPVDSGGNYTDAEGQQWICDYIDRERGKYVQCVQEIVFDGSSDELWALAQSNNRYLIDLESYGIKENYFTNKYGFVNCFGYDADTWYDTRDNIGYAQNGKIFYIRFGSKSKITSSALLREWLSENNLIYVFILNEPIETNLTQEQLTALDLSTYQGITNIGTDTMPQVGIDVEYIADTKTYIDNAIAEAIAAIPTE